MNIGFAPSFQCSVPCLEGNPSLQTHSRQNATYHLHNYNISQPTSHLSL